MPSPRPLEELRRADLQAAGALLVGLAREARRPVVRGEPGQQALLARMEQLGAGAGSADPACAASELDDAVLGALPVDVGTGSVRAELAALVTMATRTADMNESPARAQPPQAPDQPPAAARPVFVPPRLPRSPVPAAAWLPPRRSTRTRWILAATAVLLLAAVGLIVAPKPVRSLADRLLHRHPAVATTSTTSSTQPRAGAKRKPAAQVATPHPVAALAPASAGFINGVVLRPLATCRPRSGCPLTVTIRLAPVVGVERMDWAFTVVNRCTGARTSVPGGSMTAQPGWTDVYDTRTVQLPAARLLAVVAVTTAPARAASPPLLIAAGSRTC
jgi:hypothetical protein